MLVERCFRSVDWIVYLEQNMRKDEKVITILQFQTTSGRIDLGIAKEIHTIVRGKTS